MSKASEWNAAYWVAVKAQPTQPLCPQINLVSVSGHVMSGFPPDEPPRLSLMYKGDVSAKDALLLARWILDTFGDESDARRP